MPQTPAGKARSRNLAAARRSLALIKAALIAHEEALERGEIPDSSFLTSTLKYDQALAAVSLLDMLDAGAGPGPDDGTPEAHPADVAALVDVVREFVPAELLGPPGEDSAFTRLAQFAAAANGSAPAAAGTGATS